MAANLLRAPLSLLCRLGWHRWSIWTPMHSQASTRPDDEDCQERVCLRCNLEETRFWDDE